MIKLGRLRLDNFKTFKHPYEVDFTDLGLLIFDGPNGFGKTTIFDAIEICLTGKIGRILNTDAKLKQTHLYKSDKTKPTSIFLELREGDSTKAVVFAYLPANTSTDQNKPSDPSVEVKILLKWPANFDIESIPTEPNQVTLETITGNNRLRNTYDLFNYVQQEETCHFLKTSENERHNKISYLFGTSKQTEDQVKLNSIKNKLTKRKTSLTSEIQELKQSEENYTNEIKSSLDDADSGATNSFSGALKSLDNAPKASKEKLDNLSETLKDLVWIATKTQDFQNLKYNHFVNTLLDKRQQEIGDLIAVGHLNDYSRVKKREKHLRWLNALSKKIGVLKSLDSLISKEVDSLNPDTVKQFQDTYPTMAKFSVSLIERYTEYYKDIGSYQNILKKIITSRSALKNSFDAHSKQHADRSDTCPFCGDLKTSFTALSTEYNEQSEFFENLKTSKLAKLEKVENELRDSFILTCQNKSQRFISKYERLLRLIPAIEEQIIAKDKWERMLKVRDWLEKNNFKYSQFLRINEFDFIGSNQVNTNGSRHFELVEEFSTALRGSIRDADNEKMYSLLKASMDSNKVTFATSGLINEEGEAISESDLKNDIRYLETLSLALKSETLSDFRKKIKQMELQTEQVTKKEKLVKSAAKKYKDQIKEYEKSVAKQIAIPFYIYSSKILQTRPDGSIGAFIKTASDDSDRRQNNYIKFVSSYNDDHDAWNTMSSGQLSGLVLSFMMAMNKVYPTNLNTLLIDDPVQTMDEINISSFVQLLKNDFANNQIIMSTHERKSANFFAYKYQNQAKVKLLNMKDERLSILK